MTRVLVLCKENACCSIIVEALINNLGQGNFRAWSAGSAPSGFIHPHTIEILRKYGHNHDDLASKSWNNFSIKEFDFIISVCDEIIHETYPVFPGGPPRIHWNIPNPVKICSNDNELPILFDSTYLKLKEQVEDWINSRSAA
jgi:arsenate reductase (thioredoxin)